MTIRREIIKTLGCQGYHEIEGATENRGRMVATTRQFLHEMNLKIFYVFVKDYKQLTDIIYIYTDEVIFK